MHGTIRSILLEESRKIRRKQLLENQLAEIAIAENSSQAEKLNPVKCEANFVILLYCSTINIITL